MIASFLMSFVMSAVMSSLVAVWFIRREKRAVTAAIKPLLAMQREEWEAMRKLHVAIRKAKSVEEIHQYIKNSFHRHLHAHGVPTKPVLVSDSDEDT